MALTFPTHARAIVVGGGVIGTSVAYHLAKLGWSDIVMLERDRLTSGTTWHAAGLMASAQMASETKAFITQYSRQLYIDLEAETGLSTGFRKCGHLHLACSPVRKEVMRREINFLRMVGIEKHEVSARDVKDMFPLLDTTGVISAIWSPDDGRANPVDVTMSLAAGARARGVRIIESCPVTDFIVRDGRIRGVDTAQGRITAEVVVLACGMWSRELGAKIGVSVPLQAAEHYYLLTQPIDGVHADLPIVEDPDCHAYVREEGGGLLFGLFEPEAVAWGLDGIASDVSFINLPANWDRMTPFLQHAFRRFPVMNNVGIRTFFCGPESFTPDGDFIVGESPEVDGLYLATGLNSQGIVSGGGIGCLLAEEIVSGSASQDLTPFTPARRHTYESTRAFLADRIPATLGAGFSYSNLPNWKHKTARNARRLALHDRYAAKGAYFASLSGWEMPLWFAPDGERPEVAYEYGRQAWFHLSAEEHRATREEVGLFDKSFMGKFIVEGPDAEKVLNRVSANSISVPIGINVYTQWLNAKGGIISDLTVTRIGRERFLLVTGDVLQRMTPAWIRRHTRPGEFCVTTDVTSGYTILSLQGPKSREVLANISRADLSTGALPYRASTEIELGYARIRIVRVTYMGELGYELYIPTEQTITVYEALVAGIEAQGVRCTHCGLMALESLRLEKGYRDFGVDIDTTDTPFEAGLGFAIDLTKDDFIGKSAVTANKAVGKQTRRLVSVRLLDEAPLLYGNEPVWLDGRRVGYVRAGAYGHTLKASVGLAMIEREDGVTADFLKTGQFEVEVNDRLVPAALSIAPFYDPRSERVRA